VSYTKSGNRISLLPISEFCGLAAKLSEQHGAGRAAAMSSAFHAKQAGAPDAQEKMARLTAKERETIATWKAPSPVVVNGETLTYEQADKEQPVGLTDSGEWAEDGEVITCGTLDFAWVRNGVAYVGDMKKTRWSCSGPTSLQLLAYGYAWAKKHGCRAFCVGIWLIEEGEWQWADKVYELDDWSSLDLWGRIAYAATNRSGEAAFGDHCDNCYGRLHCPEYTLPAAHADTVLSAAAVGGAIDDPQKLAELLLFAQRIKGTIDKVYELAKEAARRGEPVKHPTEPKVFGFVQCKGRESLNQAKLFAAIPEATKFIERGESYQQARWLKAKR
jgi:hypothetical protein